jgi:hypothetical protein
MLRRKVVTAHFRLVLDTMKHTTHPRYDMAAPEIYGGQSLMICILHMNLLFSKSEQIPTATTNYCHLLMHLDYSTSQQVNEHDGHFIDDRSPSLDCLSIDYMTIFFSFQYVDDNKSNRTYIPQGAVAFLLVY